MAAPGEIKGKITVELSQTDRELLKKMIRALGVDPDEENEFTDTVRRFSEPSNGYVFTTTEAREQGEHFLKYLNERHLPTPEGDHILDPEADHTGEDVD